ncbi:MAG: hypothetical protein KGN84_22150 [Acidobacteriota bacterium]|nr:hypothetical protein [Acidobacteriota bacterium]
MAIAFHHRDPDAGGRGEYPRVALFPGAWNPPTVAHYAIARAALTWADEVVWVLPRAFPHKGFEGADFNRRLEMLKAIAGAQTGFSAAVSDAGLYIGIADEAREYFGPDAAIGLLCGRDAAERIATWDYGEPGVFDRMLERYLLLVASRGGHYAPASHHAERIVPLDMGTGFDEVSSTEVRDRIRRGEAWEHLAPAAIRDAIRAAYR